MAKDPYEKFPSPRRTAPLPTEKDFDPCGGHLDAQCAWQNFGGLSLEQAYELFLTHSAYYQEDFMFMGVKAFDYYFPVIDRYMREVTGDEEGYDCELSILGCGVAAQLEYSGSGISDRLLGEIERISEYVLSHLGQYSPAPKDQRRIAREWKRVDEQIAAHKSKG
ncbi:hypothetical protein SAMN02745181_0382 [Rubritalea squalenifaciens DSM 18772]|uniref:Uncharacterized protein n=1 Tax=Rubritalea squalenifaciens DSM 18772 TaxID=1123071 RepID=A0A1M6C4V6_9BACT|nr:hypothetical protein [Rubritalea squalenifaciens]SHI55768.1 hypothetical protein SAMN02745181_0382 [Rubritalea squalenifaciens DSM 18772]